jgi:hypothetical protein
MRDWAEVVGGIAAEFIFAVYLEPMPNITKGILSKHGIEHVCNVWWNLSGSHETGLRGNESILHRLAGA